MSKLIFGCGYLGKRVGRLWIDGGKEVTVLTRSIDRADKLRSEGYKPLVGDVTLPRTLSNLPAADTVLFAVGYDRSADPSIQEVYATGFQNVLAALPESVRRVIYISTTGVWGSSTGGGVGGGWVDEQTPPDPQRDGGKASWAAEQILRGSPFAARGVALRLAGIYGPGRIPFLKKLEAGEPIAAPQAGHLNLIHVDDAARVVAAVANCADPIPPVLCVSDGQPPLRGDYYREVARLIGAPTPTFVEPAAGSPRAARAASDKKVRNNLMKQQLGLQLDYPDYQAGLASILGKQPPGG